MEMLSIVVAMANLAAAFWFAGALSLEVCFGF